LAADNPRPYGRLNYGSNPPPYRADVLSGQIGMDFLTSEYEIDRYESDHLLILT
jgi:hypothetical protein